MTTSHHAGGNKMNSRFETPTCKYCERSILADDSHRPDSYSLSDWHRTAECVAVQEPGGRHGPQ